jgi:hypothetical protein
MDPATALVLVKVVHTVAWAFLAACVVAVPLCALTRRFRLALVFTAIVLGEVGVLALNDQRCPLTDVAARFTDERSANFDIYLPLWLAQYNKQLFGTLFVLGELALAWTWWRRPSCSRGPAGHAHRGGPEGQPPVL